MASVRHAVSGGEMLPIAVEKRVRELFGVGLLHGFGLTDALCFVLSNRPEARRDFSVGRPLDGIEARRSSTTTAIPVGAQEIGALEVRGPTFDGAIKTGDSLPRRRRRLLLLLRTRRLSLQGERPVGGARRDRARAARCTRRWECAVVEDRDDDGLPLPHAFVVTNIGHSRVR